jgi:hypothetical protein
MACLGPGSRVVGDIENRAALGRLPVDLQQGNEECSRRPVPVPMRDTQARAQSRGLQHMRLAAPAAPCHGRDELRPLSEPHGRQQPSKQVGGEGRAANRPPGAVLCSGGMGEVVRWFTAPAVGVGGARGGGGGWRFALLGSPAILGIASTQNQRWHVAMSGTASGCGWRWGWPGHCLPVNGSNPACGHPPLYR